MWAILAFTVGVTVVTKDRLDAGGHGGDQVVSGPDGTPGSASTTTSGPTPAPGQLRVQGTITALHLEGAVLSPRQLPTPLTIVSDRGFGNGGELTGVLVDGKPSTIVWDGGRPFELSGGVGLELDPLAVDLAPSGVRLLLGGGAHTMLPGSYQLDTPVAIGSSGIATPRDRVAFTTAPNALFEGRGDAAIVLGPDSPRRFVGPGRAALTGSLEITDARGTHPTDTLSLAQGAFDLTVTPDGAGGWRITGVMDAPTAA